MNFLIGLGFLLKWGAIFLMPPLIATLIFRGAKKKKGDKGEYKNFRMIILEDWMEIEDFDKDSLTDLQSLYIIFLIMWFVFLFICLLIALLGGFIQFCSEFNSLIQ